MMLGVEMLQTVSRVPNVKPTTNKQTNWTLWHIQLIQPHESLHGKRTHLHVHYQHQKH